MDWCSIPARGACSTKKDKEDGSQSSRAEVLRRDFMNWIVNIPLAASAARLERQGQHYIEPSIPANVARQQARQPSGKTIGRPSLNMQAADGARKGLTLDLQMFPQHKPPEEKSHRTQEDSAKGETARADQQQAKSSLDPSRVKQGSPEIPQPARPVSRRFSNSITTSRNVSRSTSTTTQHSKQTGPWSRSATPPTRMMDSALHGGSYGDKGMRQGSNLMPGTCA